MNVSIGRPLVILTASAAILGSGAVSASAAETGTAPQSLTVGACTKGSSVRLQLGTADRGTIEVGFEIDHSPAGDAWKVTLKHDTIHYFTGIRTARRRTFSVDRVLKNLPGTDTISGRATDVRSGEVCTVTAHI